MIMTTPSPSTLMVSAIKANDVEALDQLGDHWDDHNFLYKAMLYCAKLDRLTLLQHIVAQHARKPIKLAEWLLLVVEATSRDVVQHALAHIPSDIFLPGWLEEIVYRAPTDVVALCLNHISSHTTDKHIERGLLGAVRKGRADVVDLFLSHSDERWKSRALLLAAVYGQDHLVDHLYTLERANNADLHLAAQDNTFNHATLNRLLQRVQSDTSKLNLLEQLKDNIHDAPSRSSGAPKL